jgi:hypothetical protein
MTLDTFWGIIERVHQGAPSDMDAKCALLEGELRRLPQPEVLSFQNHFDDCRDRAYSHEVWAAAYVIGKGCGDDAFSDFRSTLISMGRAVFEKTLALPESLVETSLDEDNAFYESYHYSVMKISEEKAGLVRRGKPAPDHPSGTPWSDDETPAKWYPKLARKHHYKTRKPRSRWWKFW